MRIRSIDVLAYVVFYSQFESFSGLTEKLFRRNIATKDRQEIRHVPDKAKKNNCPPAKTGF